MEEQGNTSVCWSKRRKNKRARFNSYEPLCVKPSTSSLLFLGLPLPSELVLQIISYFPLNVVLQFRRVDLSSNIFVLYHLESLKWIDLSEFRKITDHALLGLLRRCNNISFLDISECNMISYEALGMVSKTFPNIHTQTPFHFFLQHKDKFMEDIGKRNFNIFHSLHNISLSEMDLRGLPLLFHSHNLRYMEIRMSKLDTTTSSNVSLSHLQRLRLERVAFMEPNTLSSLLNCIPSLEMFDIAESTGFSEAELAPLTNFKHLHTLMILGCAPDEQTLVNIRWKNIRKLALDRRDVSTASLQVITSCLLQIQALDALVLGYSLVCDSFFDVLMAKMRKPLFTVKKLILGACNGVDAVCELSNLGLARIAQIFPCVTDMCLASVHATTFANFSVQHLRTLRFLDSIYPQSELQRILDNYVNLNKLVICTYTEQADLTVSSPKLKYFEVDNADVQINFKNCASLKKIYCDIEVRVRFEGECPSIQTIEYCGVPDPIKICEMLTNQMERPKYQIIRCKLPTAEEGFVVDLGPIFQRYRGHVCIIHKFKKSTIEYDVAREIKKIARLVVAVGEPYSEKTSHPVVTFERHGTKVTTNIPIFEVMAASKSPDSRAKIGNISFWDHCLILDVDSVSTESGAEE